MNLSVEDYIKYYWVYKLINENNSSILRSSLQEMQLGSSLSYLSDVSHDSSGISHDIQLNR